MEPSAVRYEVKADKCEFTFLVVAYAVIFVSALAFIFMIFRDAQLIERNRSGIDAFSYAETHTYILLIEIVLWTIMAKAAIRFKAYAWRIRRSADGSALNLIANAMLLSFAYAILFDMASTFKTLFMNTPVLQAVTTITNLLPLGVFLALSSLLFAGSSQLARLMVDGSVSRQRHQRFRALCLALFVLVVFPYGEYFHRVAPVILDDDGLHHFVLSPATLVAVYLAPFIVIWLLGVLSCLNLMWYARHVPGKIYKPTFRNLYIGILTSYVSTYLIQIFYISNVSSNRFGFGLLFLISLIALLIIGYGLMYRGANQLYMLERGPSS